MTDLIQYISEKEEAKTYIKCFRDYIMDYTAVFVRTWAEDTDRPSHFYHFDPNQYMLIIEKFMYTYKSFLYSQKRNIPCVYPLLINNKGHFYLFNIEEREKAKQFRSFAFDYLNFFDHLDPNDFYLWNRM